MPPVDRLQDVRSKIMLALIEAGIPVEVQHHEVATAGQAEIDIRFGSLVQTADRLLTYKYIVKNVCHRLGYTATFMPKPLFGDNGSGHALPPVALERATRRSSSTRPATPRCPRWRGTTSAA